MTTVSLLKEAGPNFLGGRSLYVFRKLMDIEDHRRVALAHLVSLPVAADLQGELAARISAVHKYDAEFCEWLVGFLRCLKQ